MTWNTPIKPHRFALLSAGLWLGLAAAPARADEPAGRKLAFNRDVRPILSDACFKCHGPDSSHRKAGLRLDDGDSATADRGGYRAVEPGKPEASELVRRISLPNDDPDKMPPVKSGKALAPEQVETLRRWVAQGAPFERHWSYVPPERPPVPGVRNAAWPRGPIDRFILAKIEEEGVRPSPEADKVTLVRRLYFDLLGLPPTPAEVDAFVRDDSPDAYERLVDRMLASPHFGERVAVYWLDLVRYADSVGYHGDQEHTITPYRDWVIRSINENMLFDQFTVRQLAGDLLPGATVDDRIASGYNRVLQTSHEGGVQVKEYLAKYSADRVRNVSAVWMGATMGCAECHDHKYDPYTQKDFYSLAAFFADIDELKTFKGGDTSPTKRLPEMVVLPPTERRLLAEMEAGAKELHQQIEKASPAEVPKLKERLAELNRDIAALRKEARRTMVTASVEPRPTRVLKRGDWMDDSGEVVQPAVPHFLEPLSVKGRRATRLDLARWLTSPDHPQTSRVFVNRLWYLFFGRGFSNTLDDAGSQGEWPTHPELLDWLAVEFVESGWNVKHMVRQIVTSAAYRQASREPPGLRERDPENRLFARQGRFRLPAEMVRDNALKVSGLLVERVGGPSARPYQPDGYYAHLNFPKRTYKADSGADQYLRAVYTHWQRQFLHPMLRAFDAPSREECTAQRPVNNTPLQALTLLNDPSFVEAARVFAGRVLREGGDTDADRIRWAWREVLSRTPNDREAAVVAKLYRQNLTHYQADPRAAEELLGVGLAPRPEEMSAPELAAWTAVARALLNLNETITRN